MLSSSSAWSIIIVIIIIISVEWYEPRLNITSDFWGAENTTEDELIPGESYNDDDDDDDDGVDGGRRFVGKHICPRRLPRNVPNAPRKHTN